MRKESVLRKMLKDFARQENTSTLDITWVESHATSAGVPDVNYCCFGREGWLELKAGPDIDVRATQVMWFRNRVAAGGWPLFFIKWEECLLVVPGSRATDLRRNGSLENCLRLASSIWHGKIPSREFIRVLRNPENEYRKLERNVAEEGR